MVHHHLNEHDHHHMNGHEPHHHHVPEVGHHLAKHAEYHHLAIAHAQDPVAYWTYAGHAHHHHALAHFAKAEELKKGMGVHSHHMDY